VLEHAGGECGVLVAVVHVQRISSLLGISCSGGMQKSQFSVFLLILAKCSSSPLKPEPHIKYKASRVDLIDGVLIMHRTKALVSWQYGALFFNCKRF